MNSDGDLLRRFAETRDDSAFGELVARHLPFVYAVCLRRLRDAQAAQDAAQAVFVALAHKAEKVVNTPSLAGWLHRSACYETLNLMRAQANRLARETEAERLGTTTAAPQPDAGQLEAVLDEVLCTLAEHDRDALLARYFSGLTYAEVGTRLQLTENAARMRVERALGKLRLQLERRGVTSTAVALASALPACAVAQVPIGLAASVTHAALAGSAALGTGAALATGFMGTTKLVATGVAAVGIVAAGALLYQHRQLAEVEQELASARAESATASRRIASLQQELREVRQQRAAGGVAAPTSQPATATLAAIPPPAPPPGVTPKAPKGWFKNGSAPDAYEVGVDETNSWGGMPSAYAKSVGATDGKFGGMMQTISAETYKNQRIRLTGWVKTEDVEEGGHLWLRIDGTERGKSLQFDNMQGRAPKGTSDWQECSIVLDVPANATTLNYGFFVQGNGKMWVNGLTITPVAADVPSTDMLSRLPTLPDRPVNLGFASPSR